MLCFFILLFFFLNKEGQKTETLKLAKVGLAKVGQLRLPKVGLAKVGQIRMAKVGISHLYVQVAGGDGNIGQAVDVSPNEVEVDESSHRVSGGLRQVNP